MKKYLVWIPLIGVLLSDTPNLYEKDWISTALLIWQCAWLIIFVVFIFTLLVTVHVYIIGNNS